VTATFISSARDMGSREEYQSRHSILLRYLLDNNLFPPCGSRLDSTRERKHGHSIIVHSPASISSVNVVEVESVLAADGATFCNPGVNFLLSNNRNRGWGAATNNGACHSHDNWGLFDSLFGRSVERSDKSYKTPLSELLLGNSPDSNTDFASGGKKRHSLWIDLQASPECFLSRASWKGGSMCRVEVTRGVTYRLALPPPDLKSGHSLSVSMGDILLGHNTLERLIPFGGQDGKAWYPCPLSESSKIILNLPNGYEANMVSGKNQSGRIEVDAFAWKEGYLDLAEPWAELYRVEDSTGDSTMIEPTYGISRSVQRPLGVAGKGTLVMAVRNGEVTTSSSPSVRVESVDVIPGHLVKPRMHTLRMALYQGDGAGGPEFVPRGGYGTDASSTTCFIGDYSANQCGMVNRTFVKLSDLQDHNLKLLPDGTIQLQRTVDLAPDSSMWMMVDYDEAYLPFQKFPADPNRGVDVYPSRATFTPITTSPNPQLSTTLYSSSLLILPPVPDMSMPFNVISLSCTLWAFVLGSLINILVRRSTESVKRELTGEKEKRPIDKLKEKLCDKATVLKSKLKKIASVLVRKEGKIADDGVQPKSLAQEIKDN
jgi:hypothetical protein